MTRLTARQEALTVRVPEAARALGVSEGTLREAIRSNRSPVPVIRVGRTQRIARAELDRLLGPGWDSGARGTETREDGDNGKEVAPMARDDD